MLKMDILLDRLFWLFVPFCLGQIIAFKWSLQDRLPVMSRLSYVECNMIQCVVVFLFQVLCISARDIYLYRYGLGHPEHPSSDCRFFGGGYVWWALNSESIDFGSLVNSTDARLRAMYVRCILTLMTWSLVCCTCKQFLCVVLCPSGFREKISGPFWIFRVWRWVWIWPSWVSNVEVVRLRIIFHPLVPTCRKLYNDQNSIVVKADDDSGQILPTAPRSECRYQN